MTQAEETAEAYRMAVGHYCPFCGSADTGLADNDDHESDFGCLSCGAYVTNKPKFPGDPTRIPGEWKRPSPYPYISCRTYKEG